MNTSSRFPFLLAILDGCALNPDTRANAVHAANTPVLDRLLAECPNTTLLTHGERVGLPEGQMGNSEVGHLNIGAGRVVEQELTKINRIVSENALGANETLKRILSKTEESNGALHLIGLISEGGVHSQKSHAEALVRTALEAGVTRIVVHAITDGRDRPQTAALQELVSFETFLSETQSQYPDASIVLATVIGRYYAMDRDKRWERTKLAYDLYTLAEGERFANVTEALETRIAAGQTDEFYEPILLESGSKGEGESSIKDGDSIVCFNFRADRMRQLVSTFYLDDFTGFERSARPTLNVLATLTEYDEDFPVEVLFPPEPIQKHLGEVLSQNGITQLRIAETEKYPHVTYFFNGGEEDPFKGEERALIPSPREVATYDLKPEMSAPEITEKLLDMLRSKKFEVVVLNFANCDMVGHTGVFEAAVKAVECVDTCLGRVLEEVLAQGGSALVTADHGNADQMEDYQTGKPHTFHTTHPVPLILVGSQHQERHLDSGGALCDIAPTICELLEIKQPAEMTGRSLLR